MLAAFLRLLLALELLAYFAIALTGAGLAWSGMALLIALIALGWRLLGVSSVYLLAAAMQPQDDSPRLGAVARVRLFLQELRVLAYLYGVLLPFPHLARGTRKASPSDRDRGNLAVVLVHGIYCNGAAWRAVIRVLRQHRIGPVFAPDLGPVLGGIDQQAGQLAAALEQIAADYPARRICIVAHSMGGLVVRRMLQIRKTTPVARLITIACPHHGSQMARMGIGRAAREMTPGSHWLAALERGGSSAAGIAITSIYSRHDELVVPSASAVLEGAQHHIVDRGHVALLFCPQVHALLVSELAAAATAA